MNFDLSKRRFSYSREELLRYRNNDVILSRPMRKAIKHGIWLPRYNERNSRFRSARLRGYQARAHAQGHRWLPINTGRPPGCGDGNHLTVQPRMTSSRGISFRTADPSSNAVHNIPTIIGCRSRSKSHNRVTVPRPRFLTDVHVLPVTFTAFRAANINYYIPPTLYVLNAAAITKPHAVDHLAADMSGYNVDVGIITETHLKRKHADHIVGVDGYTLFRRDRAGRRGGGVAVYVHSRLRASV